MKIIIFGHKHCFSTEGGIEAVVTEIVKRMDGESPSFCLTEKDRNNEITVLDRWEVDKPKKTYPKTGRNVCIKRIPTLSNGKANAQLYSFFATLYCLFHKADIVFIHAEGQCAFLPLLKLFRKKTIVMVHGLDWQRAKWGNFAKLYIKFGEKMCAKYADSIIVLSESMKEYFKSTYNRDTLLIPNGVDSTIVDDTAGLTARGLSPGKYLLYLGRLEPEKRLDLLVDAYSDYCKKTAQGINISKVPSLVIAGEVTEKVKSQEWYKDAKKNPKILFWGFVSGKLKDELLSNAGLFILPSDIEGMSIALLEALAHGIPVLVSDIPENQQVLHGFGQTFKAGSKEDLEKQLSSIIPTLQGGTTLSGASLYKRNEAQIAYFKENYGWDQEAQALSALFNNLK